MSALARLWRGIIPNSRGLHVGQDLARGAAPSPLPTPQPTPAPTPLPTPRVTPPLALELSGGRQPHRLRYPTRPLACGPIDTEGPTLRRVWAANSPPPTWLPTAREHALQFLLWLRSQPILAGDYVLAGELTWMYLDFCNSLGWLPRPWNKVANQLSQLTERRFMWVELDGGRHRLRVYRIPGARSAPSSSSEVKE